MKSGQSTGWRLLAATQTLSPIKWALIRVNAISFQILPQIVQVNELPRTASKQIIGLAGCDEATPKTFKKAQLSPYKRPAMIVIMEPLPAALTGKLLKSKLSNVYPIKSIKQRFRKSFSDRITVKVDPVAMVFMHR